MAKQNYPKYCVLDGRAADVEPDYKDSMLMVVGGLRECAEFANENPGSFVATIEGDIQWHLFATGRWTWNNQAPKRGI